MATCPRCKGHLTDGHRCPKSRYLVPLEIVASAVVGGLAGWLLLAAFDPRGQASDLDSVSILIGLVAGVIINRMLRG
jgi:hypothetical protein